jgi:enoyl-CoA hydratase/carnithine racemase
MPDPAVLYEKEGGYGIIFKGLLRNYKVYKPIIAAVKGYCVADGTEIVQTTDIRVAAEDAQFAIAEVIDAVGRMSQMLAASEQEK